MNPDHSNPSVDDEIPEIFRLNPKTLFTSLKRGIPFILIFTFALVLLLPRVIKDQWEASTELIKRNKEINLQIGTPYTYEEMNIETALQTIKMPDNLNSLKEQLNLSMSLEELSESIEVKNKKRLGQIMTITASHLEEDKAIGIANTLSDIFISFHQTQEKRYYNNLLKFYIHMKKSILNNSRNEAEDQKLFKEYFDTKTELSAKKQLYLDVQQSISQVEGLIETNISNFEILQKAKEAEKVSPSKKVLLIIGLLLGLIFGPLLILMKECFDMSIKSEYDFEKILKTKMIAKCPVIKKSMKPGSTLDNLTQTNLHLIIDHLYSTPGGFPKIITVGSDIQGAGKTFLLDKIIALLLSQNKKILSISSDPSHAQAFPINPVLYDSTSKSLESKKINPNLYQNYFEINSDIHGKFLSKVKSNQLLKQQTQFDYILWELFEPNINTQLFLNTILASDSFIFVSRFRKSKRSSIKKILRSLREKDFDTIAGVLNLVKPSYL